MHSTLSTAQKRPPVPPWIFEDRMLYGVIFVSCAVAGFGTPIVYKMGGLNLVACAMTGFVFATLCLLNVRWALLSILAFSLFQAIVTRLIFSVDFPNVPEESMLDYKDLLTTTVSLLLIASACIALLHHLGTGFREVSHVLALVYTVMMFSILNGLQVFNPQNSLLVGVYGAKNNVLPFLMFFVGTMVVRRPEDLVRLMKFIAGFSLVALLYGLYQERGALPAFESYWFSRTLPPTASMFLLFVGNVEYRDVFLADRIDIRVPSVLENYTYYSYIIAAFGILVYSAGPAMAKGVWKALRVCVLVLLVLYFIVSMERAAVVMFVVGVIAVHFVHSRERRRLARFVVVGGVLISIGLAGVYRGGIYLAERGALSGNSRLIRIFELSDPLNATTVVYGRIKGQWPKVMSDIRDRPLAGNGTGTAMYTRAADREGLTMPLSQYLQEWTELGLFGLVLFVAALLFLYRALLRVAMSPDEPPVRHRFAAGMIGVTVAYSICGVFNVPFVYEPGIAFWFLAGSAVALMRNSTANPDVEARSPRPPALTSDALAE